MSDERADAAWRTLHRDTLVATALVMCGVAVAAGVPAALGIASGTSAGVALAWVLPGMVVLIGAGVAADLVRWRRTRYRVTAAAMELRQGLLVTRHRSLARDRIRSVDLTAHPILRLLGLVRVTVGTGDGRVRSATGECVLVLEPVSRADGDHLRALLLGGPGEASAPDARRLVTWRYGWVRYAPLSFWTVVVGGTAVGVMFQASEWLGAQALPLDMATDAVRRFGPWPALLGALAGFVLVGALGAVAVMAEAWWGYGLDREPGGTLRVRRGLLTTRSTSIEERRIRGVAIVEALGARCAGAARLDVVATGLPADARRQSSVLVPPAPRALVRSAAVDVAGVCPGRRLRRHPRHARTRRLRRALAAGAGLAVAVAALGVLGSTSPFWFSVVVAAAVLAGVGVTAVALDGYRSLGHGVDGDHLVARRGSVRRATVYLERQGIIGWTIRQSVFQRRGGLVTLAATTAAGSGRYAIVDADENEILQVAADAVPGLLTPFLDYD